MNINDYKEELKQEEQKILDQLIARMDKIIHKLDEKTRQYIREAKNASISVNPDQYLSIIMANKGIKDNKENRKKFLNARDELYHTRLLLEVNDSDGKDIQEIKIGLHQCQYNADMFVTDWKKPVCRHYLLDNSSTEYHGVVGNNHTDFKLLMKNRVELRFTRVTKALNLYPCVFDDKSLKELKGKNFFSDEFIDEMIRKFNPDEFDPEAAAKIISDEFLQELLERRSTPEFKNIVFSIQKKQGEIIQASYDDNIVVQGCAGSGKSMIMLHRLPIILYDNQSLAKNRVYVISPSPMYIQMAENMRYQLEISDINMGTIEQYYNLCIDRYPDHKSDEYGKIDNRIKPAQEAEKYIYSRECINDINKFYKDICNDNNMSLEKAYAVLKSTPPQIKQSDNYSQNINARIVEADRILNLNSRVVIEYFKAFRDAIYALRPLSDGLRNRKYEVKNRLKQQISAAEKKIKTAIKEMESLDEKQNSIAVQNRRNIIDTENKNIAEWKALIVTLDTDEHFESLIEISKNINDMLEPFKHIKYTYDQNSMEDIYAAFDKTDQIIAAYYTIEQEISKIEDKYSMYAESVNKKVFRVRKKVGILKKVKTGYLDIEYYNKIKNFRDRLSAISNTVVSDAYIMILEKTGIHIVDKENIKAPEYAPYLYLQCLYQYYREPQSSRDTLLAIDEAQSIAPKEIELLKNVNGGNVIFNLFGDERQHIEGTKGIDSWSDLSEVLAFRQYNMQENYRNASQITDFCNRKFSMNMKAINTPGKGVHELNSEDEFRSEIITQLTDNRHVGLAAILVSNDMEAKFLLEEFSEYKQKFHDMTGGDVGIHRTHWNIMNIADAKGLEFSSVIAISGRMTENEKYIAYTRALDELFVYDMEIDLTRYENRNINDDGLSYESNDSDTTQTTKEKTPKHLTVSNTRVHDVSAVRTFFVDKGMEVIDKRDEGGRLWVIGERTKIQAIISEAIEKFGISGKYSYGKETENKPGWCTKTNK